MGVWDPNWSTAVKIDGKIPIFWIYSSLVRVSSIAIWCGDPVCITWCTWRTCIPRCLCQLMSLLSLAVLMMAPGQIASLRANICKGVYRAPSLDRHLHAVPRLGAPVPTYPSNSQAMTWAHGEGSRRRDDRKVYPVASPIWPLLNLRNPPIRYLRCHWSYCDMWLADKAWLVIDLGDWSTGEETHTHGTSSG